jgi:hypothetical protein
MEFALNIGPESVQGIKIAKSPYLNQIKCDNHGDMAIYSLIYLNYRLAEKKKMCYR